MAMSNKEIIKHLPDWIAENKFLLRLGYVCSWHASNE